MRFAGIVLGAGLSAFALGSLAASAAGEAAPAQTFRISLSEPGIYRVTFEHLAASGLAAPVPSERLGITHRGRPVPIFVSDGGDGLFGPGDQVEFEGDRLAGEEAYLNQYSSANVYVLSTRAREAARLRALDAVAAVAAVAEARGPGAATARVDRHLERDLLLLRFADASVEPDLWTWAKLTPLEAAPFRLPLDLAGLDTSAGAKVQIRARFKGWSKPRHKPAGWPDHRIEASLGGGAWVAAEWEQSEPSFVFELPPVAARGLAAGPVELALRVPRRDLPSGDPFVDISVLDWVEVSYPHAGTLAAEQTRLTAGAGGEPLCFAVPAGSAVLYGNGLRVAGRAAGERWCTRGLPAGPLWAVRDGRLREPEVELDAPSDLASRERQADYLMIVHRRLREAILPLAEFHRRRGLTVDVVDVQDVYDEWSGGIVDPKALRSFLEHAWHHWRRPAPRFVLLVGDASWDGKNRQDGEEESPDATYTPDHGNRFPSIAATPYPQTARLATRNLIPTWSYPTADGHAAGDNYFAALDGDDINPVLAIGRFPVTEPAEVAAIVAKTVRYAESPEAGPWRREVLFVTTDDTGWQQWSDDLARGIVARGLTTRTVYPRPGAVAGEADQTALREALARGQLLVHFIGHGGRFIWRTGPPDWKKQTDLFNLKDVDLLPASGRLPVVLSMTCYSAPFDHPTADSIGEKFLRAPGKGAIAVFAASWRNTPTQAMSQPLLDELLKPGTLGEAIQRAKRRSFNRTLIEQYNLLGDPALPLAVPEDLADRGGEGEVDASGAAAAAPEGKDE